jgi:MoxR-like ATPase
MSQRSIVTELRTWLGQQIIGQESLIDRILIALLADGHLLVEGCAGFSEDQSYQRFIPSR